MRLYAHEFLSFKFSRLNSHDQVKVYAREKVSSINVDRFRLYTAL